MRGTIVNAAAILTGRGLGLAAGSRLPGRLQRIITTGLGLSTLLIGAQRALTAQNVLVVIASVVIGGSESLAGAGRGGGAHDDPLVPRVVIGA